MIQSHQSSNPTERRHWQHFGGSQPTLCILARLAAVSLCVAWFLWLLGGFNYLAITAHVFALVLGIFSFCPLGVLSAGLSLATFFFLSLFHL